MKRHLDYEPDETPPIGEVFDFHSHQVVAAPTEVAGSCHHCVARTHNWEHLLTKYDRSSGVCGSLPDCVRMTFITKEEWDQPEFKVRLVEWRLEQ